MDRIQLSAEPRSVVGKKVRFLRRQGLVPGNVYGHAASTAVQVAEREAELTIKRAGRTHLVTLNLNGGEPTTVLVKNWQRHPFRGNLLHVDFYRIAMTETLRVDLPLRIVGEAPGVRATGGSLFQPISTVQIECLPGDLPQAIEVDISVLVDLDAAVHVSDLTIPESVTLLTDPGEVVARLMPPTVEPEPEAAPAEAEAAEQPAAEGEQPAS
jgi:large subunit ribosomal protein L25